MNWTQLVKYKDPIWRSAVFRIVPTTDYPYENPVDFMVVEHPNSASGLALMVTTGYKAGMTVAYLPKKALVKSGARAISSVWLIRNWRRRIYKDCVVKKILFATEYPPGIALTRRSRRTR